MAQRSMSSRRTTRSLGPTLALYAVPLGLAALGAVGALKSPTLALASAGPGAKGNAPPAASPAEAVRARSLFGDARFRGQFSLAGRQLDGDRFVAPLADGRRLALTLDPALQARAEALLAESGAPYGAIVVMSPDGRLLALAASSTAEPTMPVEQLLFTPWAPSASVFKLVTAAALVDEGLEPETQVCYHGGLRSVERENLADDPARDGACEDLGFGLAKSQNAIVAKLTAKHLDGKKLTRAAEALGYGRAPEFALPARASTFTAPGDPLELARAAAGFWHSELSPLGGALLTATIANEGLQVTPRVVAAVLEADGTETPIPAVAPRRTMDPDTASTVAEMMVDTTRYGTAYKAFHDQGGKPWLGDVAVAGKTGSLSRNEPSYLNYSWFVGFAPAEQPRVIVAVLLGNSATWRFKSHTVARLLLQTALRE